MLIYSINYCNQKPQLDLSHNTKINASVFVFEITVMSDCNSFSSSCKSKGMNPPHSNLVSTLVKTSSVTSINSITSMNH